MTDLKRAIGLTGLTLYGLGTIIGAGIYVLIGAVADVAGMSAPLSFVIAGGLAAFTGLSFAELAARHPEAAGEAAYVTYAFRRDWLGKVVGYATILMGIVAAATIALGGAGYFSSMLGIELPRAWAAGAVIVIFTAIAAYGVKESVVFAATMTVIELGGLAVVIAAGGGSLADLPARAHEMVPAPELLSGVATGAFLAFFAFAGFENMVNMAEETIDPERTIPRALLAAIAVSTGFYLLVVLVAVLSVTPSELAASESALCLIVPCEQGAWRWFTIIALIAILNGVLIEIVKLARITFGMARRGWLPGMLGDIHPRRRTPLKGTLILGAIIFALAVGFEFEELARMTSAVLLFIFAMINASLIRLHMVAPRHDGWRTPRWTPWAGLISCIVVGGLELMNLF